MRSFGKSDSSSPASDVRRTYEIQVRTEVVSRLGYPECEGAGPWVRYQYHPDSGHILGGLVVMAGELRQVYRHVRVVEYATHTTRTVVDEG